MRKLGVPLLVVLLLAACGQPTAPEAEAERPVTVTVIAAQPSVEDVGLGVTYELLVQVTVRNDSEEVMELDAGAWHARLVNGRTAGSGSFKAVNASDCNLRFVPVGGTASCDLFFWFTNGTPSGELVGRVESGMAGWVGGSPFSALP